MVEFGLVNTTMHGIDERVPTADLVALTAIYRDESAGAVFRREVLRTV